MLLTCQSPGAVGYHPFLSATLAEGPGPDDTPHAWSGATWRRSERPNSREASVRMVLGTAKSRTSLVWSSDVVSVYPHAQLAVVPVSPTSALNAASPGSWPT